jgi:hypothetical protein
MTNTNKEIEKYMTELSKLSKDVNESRTVADWFKRLSDLEKLRPQFETLAANVGAPLLSANILAANIRTVDGRTAVANVELYIGELTNNINNTLQTKMMFNACTSAKWSCFFAAVAAIVACISVILTMCLK